VCIIEGEMMEIEGQGIAFADPRGAIEWLETISKLAHLTEKQFAVAAMDNIAALNYLDKQFTFRAKPLQYIGYE
jgi:hypothetical protein